MKQLLILTLALALAASTAVAGDKRGQGMHGGHRGGDPEQRMARMQERLGLSDAQVEQMREIRESGGGREEMREVLTEEQRAQIEERRAMHRERSHRHPSPDSEEDAI